MKKLLVLGMAIALASAVYAFPTLQGATGGVAVPNCAVATGLSATVFESAGAEIPSTFVQYGLLENLEVGLGYSEFAGVGNTMWSLNAKYMLPIDLAGIALAAGAVYSDTGATNPMNLYVSGCYAMAEDVNIIGSVMYADPDTAADSEIGVAAAIEKAFDNGVVGAELALENYNLAADNTINLYVTMAINDAVTARAQYSGILTGTMFSIGLQYAFGM